MAKDVPGALALPIARRVLRRGRRRVVITVFAPERTGDPPVWGCVCEVTGLDRVYRDRIFGEDSFQALTLSLSFLRARLSPVLSELRWYGDGEHLGIPIVLSGDERELRAIENERDAARAKREAQLGGAAKRARPRPRRGPR